MPKHILAKRLRKLTNPELNIRSDSNTMSSTMIDETKVKSEKSLFYWVFLGPISMLLSMTLLIVKTPAEFMTLPALAIIGVGLTWMTRLKGLVASLVILFAFTVYQVITNPSADSLWFLGATFSMAFSFLITYLTLEEAEQVVSQWKEGSILAFRSLMDTEVKVKALEEDHSIERENLLTQVVELEKSKTEIAATLSTLEKVQELSRLELVSSLSKHDEALEELYDLRHKKRILEDELEVTVDSLANARKAIEKYEGDKAKSLEMNSHIDTLTRERDLLESTLSSLQEELEGKVQEIQSLHGKLEDLIQSLEEEKNKPPQVIEVKVEVPAQVAEPVEEPLYNQPPATESEYRRLFGMHRQLREQFNEKSHQLDVARKELFIISEKANLLEIQLAENDHQDAPALRELSRHFEELSYKYDEAIKEIETLEEIISQKL